MPSPRVEVIGTFARHFATGLKRINVIYGGAGSGKSVAVAQHLIYRLTTEENIRVLVARKTLPALKITAYQLVRDILADLGIPHQLNKSDLTIAIGDNLCIFKSLDDPEKIKSAEFNYVWVEEATEIDRADLLQLNLRLRRQNANGENRIFLTFNPIDQFHWLVAGYVSEPRENVAVHHSVYRNNPFLPPEYVAELEGLVTQDENYYRIYCLGEPGVLRNVVYTNYDTAEAMPLKGELAYGLDFGFNNPTALAEIRIVDGEVYVRERLYEPRLTNADLIARLGSLGVPKGAPIYADAAEPARIEELRRAGYNVHPADKSVKDGIDCVKRHRLHITTDSTNLLGEIRSYKYREDRNGVVLEEPVKFRDHIVDAVRYCLHTHLPKLGGATVPLSAIRSPPSIPTLGGRPSTIPRL